MPSALPDLFRWYRADSYLPLANDTTVGVLATTPWPDVSGTATPYTAWAQTGREARFLTAPFARPVLRVCGNGGTSGCTGVTMNQHMRIASSFNDFANTDLTVIFVAARANANANYLLVNQSIGNNSGTFMGWTGSTSFRFGLTGPSATTAVTATIPAYSGTPTLEIWTGRLNTGSSADLPGLRISRNGLEVAANAAVTTQQAAATTIPYVGTQRSDHAGAQFHVAEILIYKRALSPNELCVVHTYLSTKYQLTLEAPCTP